MGSLACTVRRASAPVPAAATTTSATATTTMNLSTEMAQPTSALLTPCSAVRTFDQPQSANDAAVRVCGSKEGIDLESLSALHAAFCRAGVKAAASCDEPAFGLAAQKFMAELMDLTASAAQKAQAEPGCCFDRPSNTGPTPDVVGGPSPGRSGPDVKAGCKRSRPDGIPDPNSVSGTAWPAPRQKGPMTSQSGAGLLTSHGQQRLRDLLQKLPPDIRQDFIKRRMTEAQRVQLERWMVNERAFKATLTGSTAAFKAASRVRCANADAAAILGSVSLRSLCCWRGRGRLGYRPIMHLGARFYAQAAFTFELPTAVAALGCLLAMRFFCQWSPSKSRVLYEGRRRPQDAALLCPTRAVQLALAGCPVGRLNSKHKFYFKARWKRSGGQELMTPPRLDPVQALHDQELLWAQVGASREWTPRAPRKGSLAQLSTSTSRETPQVRKAGRVLQQLERLLATAQVRGDRRKGLQRAHQKPSQGPAHRDEGSEVLNKKARHQEAPFRAAAAGC